jgi:hypothetical protein
MKRLPWVFVSVRGVRQAVVVAGVVAFATAGCGSSKQAAVTAPKPLPRLTEKHFVAAADEVCVNSDRRIFNLGALSTAPAGWTKTAAAAATALHQMAALRPPSANAAGFGRLLKLGRRLRQDVQHVALALTAKNLAAARRAQLAATTVSAQIHAEAKTLGLTFCEQPQTNWPA